MNICVKTKKAKFGTRSDEHIGLNHQEWAVFVLEKRRLFLEKCNRKATEAQGALQPVSVHRAPCSRLKSRASYLPRRPVFKKNCSAKVEVQSRSGSNGFPITLLQISATNFCVNATERECLGADKYFYNSRDL